MSFFLFFLGWADDSIFIRRPGQDEDLAGAGGASSVNAGAFTTGRRGRVPPPPVKPRTAGQQVPGKLNLSDFQKVSAALNSMQIDPSKRASPRSNAAPLATSEDMDQQGYAVPRDNLVGLAGGPGGGSDDRSSGGRLPPPPPPPGRALPPPPPPGAPQGTEYAQPVDQPPSGGGGSGGERRHHSRPKHRERREQLAMQQGEKVDN